MPVFVGQKDRYTTPDHPVAEGGQAWVYRGRGRSGGQEVAVKVAQGVGDAGAWLDREHDEITALLQQYPDLAAHLITFLDRGEVSLPGPTGPRSHRFVVMPWSGVTLAEWIVGQPVEAVFEALAKAAEAITRLHLSGEDVRQGVVHRDIKPSNFLVRDDGVVLLSDFGGAKRAHLRTASLNTGMHTEGFAPPDQILPRRITPDQSWDVYALAVTVFWCITRTVPISVMQASKAFTGDGWSLFQLKTSAHINDTTRTRLEELSRRPDGELIRLDELTALTGDDRRTLTTALAGLLTGRVGDAEELAEEVAGELCDRLELALQPDRRKRTPDARGLQTLCTVMAKKIRRSVARQQAAKTPPLRAPEGDSVDWSRVAEAVPTPGPTPMPESPSGDAVAPRPPPVIGDTIRPRVEPPEPEPKPEPEPEPELDDEVLVAQGASGGGRLLGVVAVGCLGAVLVTGAGVTLFGALSGEESVPAVAVTPSAPSAGEVREFGGVEFAYIPAGRFTMGSPEDEEDRGNDEVQHEVELSRGFWLQTTEVTQGQWREMSGNPSNFSSCGSSCPVENVSWLDAVGYANWRSEQEGLESCYVIDGAAVSWPKGLDCAGYRLPTESEWEWAARAGRSRQYSGSNDVDAVAWYSGNSGSTTHPVGQKASNGWGLYDMSGNVWEWCWDRSGDYPTNASVDPLGASTGSYRVRRGGSWSSDPASVRVAFRFRFTPSGSNNYLGLRLARSL